MTPTAGATGTSIGPTPNASGAHAAGLWLTACIALSPGSMTQLFKPRDGMSATARRKGCLRGSNPDNNGEHLDGPTAFAQVAAINSLSPIPMIVVTADHHSYPGLAASEEARLDDVWKHGQAHWRSLTTSAQLVSVDNTSHNIQLDRPEIVLDKIKELLR